MKTLKIYQNLSTYAQDMKKQSLAFHLSCHSLCISHGQLSNNGGLKWWPG